MVYPFKKSDLQYKYHWAATKKDNQTRNVDFPASVSLNREQGDDVLAFIIHCATSYAWVPDKGVSGQQFEALIHRCPPELRSQQAIKDWIEANWYKVV